MFRTYVYHSSEIFTIVSYLSLIRYFALIFFTDRMELLLLIANSRKIKISYRIFLIFNETLENVNQDQDNILKESWP